MLEILFWVAVGLVVGWNIFPQPKVVADLYQKVVDWVKQ